MKKEVIRQLQESAEVKVKSAETLADLVVQAAEMIADTYQGGGKVLIMGNGGSAADAQHIAGELVGRFRKERRALPAIALTTDTSILTALGNDYGYDLIFARQVEALANHPKDLLLAISTSGNSPNVMRAVEEGKKRNLRVIGFLGRGGGKLKDLVDCALVVPSDDTQRIQETHITLGHIICDLVERALFA
ncbi:MAG: D-sedoheptulose 7-phosphate isomerase [Candidatus Sungiibacteriota bacterium]|uniref:Phosphoheptose isomerase n=1 Tax=Candidatus Sungiibacteriota bacterium TaxID=2750080 RepID=A0A7T5UQS7_9BACT|nr:MAG: D-sedoheptulose 7-phosphate isomerase [Candidatus Sungbacteria bacterium]